MIVKNWHKDGKQTKRKLAPRKVESLKASTKELVKKLKQGGGGLRPFLVMDLGTKYNRVGAFKAQDHVMKLFNGTKASESEDMIDDIDFYINGEPCSFKQDNRAVETGNIGLEVSKAFRDGVPFDSWFHSSKAKWLLVLVGDILYIFNFANLREWMKTFSGKPKPLRKKFLDENLSLPIGSPYAWLKCPSIERLETENVIADKRNINEPTRSLYTNR